MKKLYVTIFLFLLILIGCDTTFKAEKVESENYNHVLTEMYLVSNSTYSRKVTDSILLNTIVRERFKEIYKENNNIHKYVSVFYVNSDCTKRYFKNYKYLKRVEDVTEKCEDVEIQTFVYEKSKENNNMWYLKSP